MKTRKEIYDKEIELAHLARTIILQKQPVNESWHQSHIQVRLTAFRDDSGWSSMTLTVLSEGDFESYTQEMRITAGHDNELHDFYTTGYVNRKFIECVQATVIELAKYLWSHQQPKWRWNN